MCGSAAQQSFADFLNQRPIGGLVGFEEAVLAEVVQRVRQAMLDEAATVFLNGEPDTARIILRDLVNATIGFEQLANSVGGDSKSLHRMLSATGNPNMDNLAAIFGAVRKSLKVELEVHAKHAA